MSASRPGRSVMGIPRRLTLDLGDDYPTAWTRDSKSVILTSDRNGPMAIFLQDLKNRRRTSSLSDRKVRSSLVSHPTASRYCSMAAIERNGV